MKHFIASTIVTLILGISGIVQADTVYTWTDKDGVVHMTNYPPPTGYAEKTAITSPEETREGRDFRAKQKAAMDRMEQDYKKADVKVERSQPPAPREEKGESPEERRARIREKISELEVKEKRYHTYRKNARSDSDKRYWYDLQKAAEVEIDGLKRELTR